MITGKIFMKGGDLLRQLKKRIKFDTDITKFCASEIVVALGHMHRLKIIHRFFFYLINLSIEYCEKDYRKLCISEI